MTSEAPSPSGPITDREGLEEVRIAIAETERKMKAIKDASMSLQYNARSSSTTTSSSSSSPSDQKTQRSNALSLSVLQVTGLPATVKPSFRVQISSPIEELSISKVFDPLEPEAEGSIVSVSEVDVDAATLIVTVHDDEADVDLGSSEPYEILSLCQFDPLSSSSTTTTTHQIELTLHGSGPGITDCREDTNVTTPTSSEAEETEEADVNVAEPPSTEETEPPAEWEGEVISSAEATEETEEGKEETKATTGEKDNDDEEEEETKATPIEEDKAEEEETKATITEDASSSPTETVVDVEDKVAGDAMATTEPATSTGTGTGTETAAPIVTTLRVTYTPSVEEQLRTLQQLMVRETQTKRVLIDKLRVYAQETLKEHSNTNTTMVVPGGRTADPAVKPGFLHNRNATVKKPNRFVRFYQRTFGPDSLFRRVLPMMKNYIFFFGTVALFHFQGNEFALPPPE